ncbi:hypothetical protein THAOC_13163, partial [Thalassiosira oceanica]
MYIPCGAFIILLSLTLQIQIGLAGGFSTGERASRSVASEEPLDGTGITSLLVLPPHPPVAESEENDAVPRVLVGTKRGVLKELRIDRLDGRTGGWTARDLSDASGVALKPYPIYSMLELGGRVLAAGATATSRSGTRRRRDCGASRRDWDLTPAG